MLFDFEKELEYAKIKMKDSKRIQFLFKIMKSVLDYTKRMEGKGLNTDEIFDKLHEQIFYYIDKYSQLSGTSSLQKQFNTLLMYTNNEHLLERDYKLIEKIEISDEEVQKRASGIDSKEDWNKFILQLSLRDLNITKEQIKQDRDFNEFLTLNPSEQKKVLKLLDYKEKKEIEKKQRLLKGETEEQLKEYVAYNAKKCENELKRIYIETLILAGEFLREFNFLEEDLDLYNTNMRKLSMQGLSYCLKKEEKTESTDIALEEIFEREQLEKLNVEELALLNLFWQNRFVKRVKDVSDVMFAIRTLSNDKEEIKLTDNNVLNVMYKKIICDNIFLKISRSIKKGKKYKIEDFSKTDKEFIEKYQKYFNMEIPECDNDFAQDMNVTNMYGNIQFNAYNAKTNIVQFFMQNFQNNKTKVTNWGIILDNKEANKNYIIIGIDYPGFNLPLKVHCLKSEILEFIKYLQGNTILPIYNGNNDMIYKGKSIKTNILMPLTQKKQKYIIDKVVNVNPVDLKYLLIRHLGNLVTIKNKKTTKIYPQKYIDIETGKTGIKIGRKFIEDQEVESQMLEESSKEEEEQSHN